MAVRPQEVELGIKAPDFSLPSTDGKTVSLSDVMGENGLVLVFICNHCPYVKAITDRMILDAATLSDQGIGFVAICSNDAVSHPGDSFENMAVFAQERGFTFPYLHDETQQVAKAYKAVCTPDFFGISGNGLIEYRGRMDNGRMNQPSPNARRDLVLAMEEIAKSGKGPSEQIASAGCSIKWAD